MFHLAAILSARGEQDPRLAYDVNQTGTWNVLEACRRAKVGRLIFTSSIAVFGPPPSGPLPDPTPDDVALHPTTMYGVTKVAGELLCAYYRKRYGIDCRGVRFPGLISAAMPGGGSSDYALFMYVDAVRKGGYEAFARADTRIPLMYMPDGVRALLELAFADRAKLTRTIYNIAAFSPRADEIAASVQRAMPDAKFTYARIPCARASSTAGRSRSTTAPRAATGAGSRSSTSTAMTDDLRAARQAHARARRDPVRTDHSAPSARLDRSVVNCSVALPVVVSMRQTPPPVSSTPQLTAEARERQRVRAGPVGREDRRRARGRVDRRDAGRRHAHGAVERAVEALALHPREVACDT